MNESMPYHYLNPIPLSKPDNIAKHMNESMPYHYINLRHVIAVSKPHRKPQACHSSMKTTGTI
jgi:hypothetical protein